MFCPHCHALDQLFIEAVNGDKDLVCLSCGFRKDLRYTGAPLKIIQLTNVPQYSEEIKMVAVSLRRNNFPYKDIQEQLYNQFQQKPSPKIIQRWVKSLVPVA